MTKERKEMVVKVTERLGKNHPLVGNFITLANDITITEKMLDDVYKIFTEKF